MVSKKVSSLCEYNNPMIYLTPIVLSLVKLGRTKVVRYTMGFSFHRV